MKRVLPDKEYCNCSQSNHYRMLLVKVMVWLDNAQPPKALAKDIRESLAEYSTRPWERLE